MQLVGWEKVGSGLVTVFVVGDVAAVKAAVDAGASAASKIGEVVSVQVIPRPHEELASVLPKGGQGRRSQRSGAVRSRIRLRCRCTEARAEAPRTTLPANIYSSETANRIMNEAIGLIETKGLVAQIEAADAMLKAANITLVGQIQIGGAYVTTVVRGDVGSVRAAVDAGAQVAKQVGDLVSAHVIARPEKGCSRLFSRSNPARRHVGAGCKQPARVQEGCRA